MTILPLEELREIRRKLAEENGLDVKRYAAMLAKMAEAELGAYVDKPRVPHGQHAADIRTKSAS